MEALLPILALLVPLGVLVYAWERVRSSTRRRAVGIGLVVVWLAAAYVALALLAFLLFTPSGIGPANWPELAVSLAVVIGLPAWLVIRAGRRRA
jgi:hypothetical protein